jgi:L-threonylcarbamoyladenylate synthase
VRVPALPPALAALGAVRRPVLQSSANAAGGPDARRLADVPAAIRRAADLVLDGGELPGTPSTVVDLRRYEAAGEWTVLREGAVPAAAIARTAG